MGTLNELKRRHPEAGAAYNAWWRGITREGDPRHRPNLVFEAFCAAWEISRATAPIEARLSTMEKRQEVLADTLRTFLLAPDAESQFTRDWEDATA